jgi:hypothetical protein
MALVPPANSSVQVKFRCEGCGKEEMRFPSQAKGRFCSRACVSLPGRMLLKCCWPGCEEEILCKPVTFNTRHGPRTTYQTDFKKRANYKRFLMCEAHQDKMRAYLGRAARPTRGRAKILSDPDAQYDSRTLSSRFLRMIVFERAEKRCEGCAQALGWTDRGAWVVDHRIPWYLGGRTSVSNSQLLCVACHDEKTRSEKSSTNRNRHKLAASGRWLTHTQKTLLIDRMRARLIELGEPPDYDYLAQAGSFDEKPEDPPAD